jgi:hypothetical protein
MAVCAWNTFLLFIVVVSSGKYVSSDHVNIWIIPHTHDDTGWLQTVDEYYVKQVHWILETVVCCQNIIAIVDKTSTVTFVLF